MQVIKKHRLMSWLFDEESTENSKNVCYLPIHTITPNPYQPRREFDLEGLEELSHSIKKHGVLQPLIVRRLYNGSYELVAGERRLRASSMAGMLKVPVIVAQLNDHDSAVVALVENIQRKNLSFMEEARAFRSLLYHHGLTQEELAAKVGKSQSFIANRVRLLKLSKTICDIISDHNLSERHARALLQLDDENEQLSALEKICAQNLNVRQSEELISSIKDNKIPKLTKLVPRRAKITEQNNMKLFVSTIRHAVDLMQRHGIEAVSTHTEFDDHIEYLIKVQKFKDGEKIS